MKYRFPYEDYQKYLTMMGYNKKKKENKTMNKKDFIEIMNEIDKHIAVEKNIEELEISMNDNHDLVKFFVYGVNFAKKEPLVVYINNEKVSIHTNEELYDTLLRIMDENVEVLVGRK